MEELKSKVMIAGTMARGATHQTSSLTQAMVQSSGMAAQANLQVQQAATSRIEQLQREMDELRYTFGNVLDETMGQHPAAIQYQPNAGYQQPHAGQFPHTTAGQFPTVLPMHNFAPNTPANAN